MRLLLLALLVGAVVYLVAPFLSASGQDALVYGVLAAAVLVGSSRIMWLRDRLFPRPSDRVRR